MTFDKYRYHTLTIEVEAIVEGASVADLESTVVLHSWNGLSAIITAGHAYTTDVVWGGAGNTIPMTALQTESIKPTPKARVIGQGHAPALHHAFFPFGCFQLLLLALLNTDLISHNGFLPPPSDLPCQCFCLPFHAFQISTYFPLAFLQSRNPPFQSPQSVPDSRNTAHDHWFSFCLWHVFCDSAGKRRSWQEDVFFPRRPQLAGVAVETGGLSTRRSKQKTKTKTKWII